MKKVSYVLAALATIAVAAPTVASAEGFGFRFGSDRDYYRDEYRGPRAEFYGHDLDSIAAGTTTVATGR